MGSLREAQPHGAGPRAGRSRVPEARGGPERRRGGRPDPRRRPRARGSGRGSRSGSFSRAGFGPGSGAGACSGVAEDAPELTRDFPVAHPDPFPAKWGPPRGGPRKGTVSRRITGSGVVRKRVFNNCPFFTHGQDVPGAPGPLTQKSVGEELWCGQLPGSLG